MRYVPVDPYCHFFGSLWRVIAAVRLPLQSICRLACLCCFILPSCWSLSRRQHLRSKALAQPAASGGGGTRCVAFPPFLSKR